MQAVLRTDHYCATTGDFSVTKETKINAIHQEGDGKIDTETIGNILTQTTRVKIAFGAIAKNFYSQRVKDNEII